jgi:hypothetical protein
MVLMENMMSDKNFAFGDRVRHNKRPEWGIGTVTKIEDAPVLNGSRPQRLSIRFPNAGIKTLISNQAELEKVNGLTSPYSENGSNGVEAWSKVGESDWLSGVAERKVKESMIALPPDVRDPFNSMQKRLTIMLDLYRFNRSGRGLMDWAVAQSGLDDPLSKFTRQDLEQFFDRWVCERDNYLAKLLQEARTEQAAVSAAMRNAPPAGQDAMRRLIASR